MVSRARMILRRASLLLSGSILFCLFWCAPAGAAEKIHVVRKGETLSSIAQEHRVSGSALVRRNHLKDSNRLLIGQRLIIPRVAVSTTKYTVQKGESLAVIAKKMGVSVKDLAVANNISEPDKITVGQVLVIPGSGEGESGGTALDPRVRERLNKIRCSARWKNIIVHHSATSLATPKSMDAYHHARGMENGLAYHFVIGNGFRMKDGEIYIAPRWQKQLDGGHLSSEYLNRISIGVCLVGDFDRAPPSARQMESLVALTRYLMQRCRISRDRVKTHRQINTKPTECPGRKFPTSKFHGQL